MTYTLRTLCGRGRVTFDDDLPLAKWLVVIDGCVTAHEPHLEAAERRLALKGLRPLNPPNSPDNGIKAQYDAGLEDGACGRALGTSRNPTMVLPLPLKDGTVREEHVTLYALVDAYYSGFREGQRRVRLATETGSYHAQPQEQQQ